MLHTKARISANSTELSLTSGIYMSAWILIYSYIFSLNLSRDCSIVTSCPSDKSVHHLVTKWIAFAAPALRSRSFQEMRKCGRNVQPHIRGNFDLSVQSQFAFQSALLKTGSCWWLRVFFPDTNQFSVCLKFLHCKEEDDSFWVCAETWWGIQQGSNRLVTNQQGSNRWLPCRI